MTHEHKAPLQCNHSEISGTSPRRLPSDCRVQMLQAFSIHCCHLSEYFLSGCAGSFEKEGPTQPGTPPALQPLHSLGSASDSSPSSSFPASCSPQLPFAFTPSNQSYNSAADPLVCLQSISCSNHFAYRKYEATFSSERYCNVNYIPHCSFRSDLVYDLLQSECTF